MTVSLAERIKAVERVRNAIAPNSGGTPSFKRKRAVYRALERGDFVVACRYELELGMIRLMAELVKDLLG